MRPMGWRQPFQGADIDSDSALNPGPLPWQRWLGPAGLMIVGHDGGAIE
jgi:hypothetical protein